MGSAQKSLNKFEEAILSYKKSIALKANNVEACYNLATLNYFLENYNEASNYFKNIVNLKVRQEEICERFTICLFKTGKKTEVKDFVLTVISKFPRNKVLNNLLGRPKKDGTPYKGWTNHPCCVMWRGYEDALKLYLNESINVWIERGKNNTMEFEEFDVWRIKMPWWLGYEPLHASHRSNLLRKDKE